MSAVRDVSVLRPDHEEAKAFDHEHGRLYDALKVAEERAELAGDNDIASEVRILRAKVGRHIEERWCGR